MLDIKSTMPEGRNGSLICNVIVLKDIVSSSPSCTVMVTFGQSAVRRIQKFVPPSDSPDICINPDSAITGYTFLHDELVICYVAADSCAYNLVDVRYLKPLNDSISGLLAKDADMIFDAPLKMYKAVNADSLWLVKSSFIP